MCQSAIYWFLSIKYVCICCHLSIVYCLLDVCVVSQLCVVCACFVLSNRCVYVSCLFSIVHFCSCFMSADATCLFVDVAVVWCLLHVCLLYVYLLMSTAHVFTAFLHVYISCLFIFISCCLLHVSLKDNDKNSKKKDCFKTFILSSMKTEKNRRTNNTHKK